MKIIITKIILSLLLVSCLLFIVPAANSEANLIQYGIPYATRPYIVFPSNLTYKFEVSSLNVSFHADIYGNFNYSMMYSLDGQEKSTLPLTQHYFGIFNQAESYIDGSVTLPTLFNGSHSIEVFLTLLQETSDNTGHQFHAFLDVQTVYFTTEVAVLPTPSHTPTPSPTLTSSPSIPEIPSWIIPLLLGIMLATAGLLVYHKKHKGGLVKKL